MKKLALFITFNLFLVGCASLSNGNPQDPLEKVNRPLYSFNRGLDKVILKPVTKGYKAITPDPVEKSVSNIFGNLDDVITMTNGLLQGKIKQSGSDLGRVVINSTIGIVGIFDVASKWGLKKHDEDFGQTLGYWGIKPGPYLMLPFLGPSDFRDAWGQVGDYLANPVTYFNNKTLRYALTGMDIINTRASLLRLDKQLEESLDEYAFVRDAYIQNRQYRVYDGNPPETDDWLDEDDDCLEDDCDLEEDQ